MLAYSIALGARLVLLAIQWPDLRLSTSYVVFIDGSLDSVRLGEPGPNLFPLLAAGLKAIGLGYGPVYALLLSAVYSTVAPAALVCARCLRLRPAVGWVAAAGTLLLWLQDDWQDGMTSFLFTVTFAAYLVAVGRRFAGRSLVVLGVAFFALLLDRPNSIVLEAFLVVLALALEWHDRRRGAISEGERRRIWCFAAVFCCLVAGASLVNQLRFERFTPFPPYSGQNVFNGNNPWTGRYLRDPHAWSAELAKEQKGFPRLEFQGRWTWDDKLRDLGLTYAIEHPGETIANLPWKVLRYLGGPFLIALLRGEFPYPPRGLADVPLAAIHAWVVLVWAAGLLYNGMILGGYALLLARRRDRWVLVLATVPFVFMAPYMLVTPVSRYRMHAEVVWMLVAAVAATEAAYAVAGRCRRMRAARARLTGQPDPGRGHPGNT